MARSKRDASTDGLADGATGATVVMDFVALADGNQALTVQAQALGDLMERYGVSTCNLAALEAEIRGFQQTAVEAMFAIGARLILVRQLCERGDWEPTLVRLDMAPRAAQRVMQATVKFAASGKVRERLLGLGKGKLLELLTCDDEDLDALEAGEMMGELALDDVASMSVSELKFALRKMKLDAAAKDKLLATRAEKIEVLEMAAAAPYVPCLGAAAQTAAEQLQFDELAAAHNEATAALARLAVVVRDVQMSAPQEAMVLAANGAVVHLAHALAAVVQEHGIEVDFAAMVESPQWLAGVEMESPAPSTPATKAKRLS